MGWCWFLVRAGDFHPSIPAPFPAFHPTELKIENEVRKRVRHKPRQAKPSHDIPPSRREKKSHECTRMKSARFRRVGFEGLIQIVGLIS